MLPPSDLFMRSGNRLGVSFGWPYAVVAQRGGATRGVPRARRRPSRSLFVLAVALFAAGCGTQARSHQGTAPSAAGLIAFSRQASGGLDRIYVVEPNGHGLRALTSARLDAVDPVWSPNGKQIAYIAGQFNRLYVMNRDASHKHLVSNGAGPLGGATRPTWSPDGKRLLFYVGTFPGHALYVVDADGTHLHRLSRIDSYDPAWSPRGDLIAVTLRGNRIAELNAAGAEVRILTHPGFCAEWPTWSPDGKKIAYAVSRGSCANPSSIHVVNVDGSHDTALTHHRFGTFDQAPAWSPNGGEIAFQCAGGPIFGAICVLNLRNPAAIRFAAGVPGDRDFDPSWEPPTG